MVPFLKRLMDKLEHIEYNQYKYHNYIKSIYKPISYLWEEKIKLT